MKKLFFIFAIFVSLYAQSLPKEPEPKHSFELGLFYQLLLPNHLPSFDTNLSTYGLRMGVPILGTLIQAEVGYGELPNFKFLLGVLNLKIPVRTPFLTLFFFTGPHWFNYTAYGSTQNLIGLNLGLGATLEMSKTVTLDGVLKLYLQQRTVVGFETSFAFLL